MRIRICVHHAYTQGNPYNRVFINEEEIIDFIIDGILIESLRDYVRIANYRIGYVRIESSIT